MIASLPMYDRPEMADVTDRYWQAIRTALGFGPVSLTRDRDVWDMWQSPDLLLSQTCGMPYRARLHDKVRLVGTPDFDLPGCPPGYYNSVWIVRQDDPRTDLTDFDGGRFAYNDPISQSGWAGPMAMARGLGVSFGKQRPTGSHAQSLIAVAGAHADIAALDAQTWRLLQRYLPEARAVRVLDHTPPRPGLPYITALHQDAAPIADAIRTALCGLDAQDRAALGIRDLIDIPDTAYLAVTDPEPVRHF